MYVTPDNFNLYSDLSGQKIENSPFLSIYVKTEKVFFNTVNIEQLRDKISRYSGLELIYLL